MADKKQLTPLDELERRHTEAAAAMQKEIDALAADLREADAMVRELRAKLANKQQQKIAASFAYDAAVTELAAAEKSKAAA